MKNEKNQLKSINTLRIIGLDNSSESKGLGDGLEDSDEIFLSVFAGELFYRKRKRGNMNKKKRNTSLPIEFTSLG